ncbi:MAG: flagellar export chaperone FliS [Treponemataceae bacterium]|nr:flagellar export chaperone FliS [Treponemataceae bacterium]
MAYNQAFSAYKTTGVKTATQGKLLIMLYDEAIKQLKMASSYFNADGKVEASNIERMNKCVQKAQEVITELMASLNMNIESAKDIAENLLSLYFFFNKELMNATINQDKSKIDFVCNMMSELRGAWAQADTMTQTHTSEGTPSFSISG